MIVIIEGLDGVGKTTICEEILKRSDMLYVKESYTDSNKEKERRVQYMLTRLMSDLNFIYDRTTLIDDFVYSFLNKKQSSLIKYYSVIKAMLSQCKIIHLTIDEKIQKQRLEQRGDEYISSDMLKQIELKYRAFYNNLDDQIYYIELSGNLDEDVDKIMEVIND